MGAALSHPSVGHGDAVTAQKRHLVRLPAAVASSSALVIGGHHTRCFARRGFIIFLTRHALAPSMLMQLLLPTVVHKSTVP